VYLSSGEVVFVFEGHEVEWALDDVVDARFNWMLSEALERWQIVSRSDSGSPGNASRGRGCRKASGLGTAPRYPN
jgi:hypothetical protein